MPDTKLLYVPTQINKQLEVLPHWCKSHRFTFRYSRHLTLTNRTSVAMSVVWHYLDNVCYRLVPLHYLQALLDGLHGEMAQRLMNEF